MDLVEAKERGGRAISRHPWELARLSVVVDLLREKLANQPGFSVLDIGCGDIFFVSALSERFPEVDFYAVDTAFTDEIMAELSKEIKGKKIRIFRSLEDASHYMTKPADLVLLLDVLEHIEDDNGFLEHLVHHKAMGKGGTLIITVPAFQSLFCSHDHFLGHYRRYTNASLSKVVSHAGFTNLKSGYFFSSLVPLRYLQVLKEKVVPKNNKNATTGLVEWKGGKVRTALFKSFLFVDYKLTRLITKISGVKIAGLSNYLICKKPA
jgi:hypothetical protein